MNARPVMNTMLMILTLTLLVGVFTPLPAFASSDSQSQIIFPNDPAAAKYIAAGLAFGLAALAAGLAIGRAGSAGMAATAERPEVKTTAIIIAALGEALAIYGLVVALLIVGA